MTFCDRVLAALVLATMLAVFVGVSAAEPRALPLPPEPRPENPIDYLAWLNEAYNPPLDRDAGPVYARVRSFWPYADADTFLAPFIKGPWAQETPLWKSRKLKYAWAKDAFLRATDLPDCFIPLTPFGEFADFKISIEFEYIRWPAKLLVADAWHDFAGGREQPLMEAVRRCLQAADHLAQQPTLGAQFQAASLFDFAAAAVLRGLHESRDVGSFGKLLPPMRTGSAPVEFPMTTLLAGEMLGAYDACQRCFRWDVAMSRYLIDRLGVEIMLTLHGEIHPDAGERARKALGKIEFQHTVSMLSGYYALAHRLLARPYVDFMSRAGELDAYRDRFADHPFAELMLFPSRVVTDVRRRIQQAEARWHAGSLVAAILQHQIDHGHLPQSLAALDRQFLSSIAFASEEHFQWEYSPANATFRLVLRDHAARIAYWPVDPN